MITRRTRVRGIAAVVAALSAAAALIVVPAGASQAAVLSCVTRTTSQIFSAHNDANFYFLAPGGDFESTANGWTWLGASRVSGNETFRYSSGSYAASLPSGASLISPQFCIRQNEDSIRFVYYDPGVRGAYLNYKVTVFGLTSSRAATGIWSSGSPGWKVSPRIAFPVYGTVDLTKSDTIGITLGATGTTARWKIDSLFVDPWRTV